MHLFFDLDHTIWDFDKNAEETLYELFDLYQIQNKTDHSPESFVAIYKLINDKMWDLYRQNLISKAYLRTERFVEAFKEMGVPETEIPNDIWERYIELCPTKTNLIPGAIELLDYLAPKYQLHIITNGFSETQRRKLKHSQIEHYFSSLTISEEVGAKKPEPQIFHMALTAAKSSKKVGTYIGDNLEADVKGALNVNWNVFWYNPHEQQGMDDYPRLTSIKKLNELKLHF